MMEDSTKSTQLAKESEMEENARLRIENLELRKRIKELEEKALFDNLTGLKSRTALDEEMEIYFRRIYKRDTRMPERRHEGDEESLIFAIFDIDRFKSINDNFGHKVGDLVLKKVGETISSCVRDYDLVARWGGEEFVVVFPGANMAGAEMKANLIRRKISEKVFEGKPDLKITISAGLADSQDFENEEDLFNAADKALYESKNSGRNKVTKHSKISQQSD